MSMEEVEDNPVARRFIEIAGKDRLAEEARRAFAGSSRIARPNSILAPSCTTPRRRWRPMPTGMFCPG